MKPYTVIRATNHADWLKAREGGIGSSEVGVILGLSPWSTPYQLWREKRGLNGEYVEQESFSMKAGHYLEDAVSRFYSDETGREIIKNSAEEFVVVDNEKPFLRVSPDRTFWLPDLPHKEHYKGVVECKTSQISISEDDLPKHWFVQLMYQLGVYRLSYGALAWLVQGREFGFSNIDFDKELYDYIVDRVTKFWVDNVIGGTEPDLISIEDILIKYPRHEEGKIIEATQQAFENYERLKSVNAEIKELSAKKATLEESIKKEIGDAEGIAYRADSQSPLKTLATWKAGKDKDAFNLEKFAAENPELYRKYVECKPASRRFLLK